MSIIEHVVWKIRSVLGSRPFLWLVVVLFVVQAVWITLSARYPQAFDEQFHFGIIRVYSHYWLPFLNSQPPGADPYGAVARDPSFLYHYVMSWPYRIIELFTHNQTAQIVALRLVNVALFTYGLMLFRKVLRRTGLSEVTANVSIFMTTLIPVAPQLAGQINYDNLVMPMTAWACLLSFGVVDSLNKRRISIVQLLGLVTVCLLSSMIKYEFLPIFLGAVVFLVFFVWRKIGISRKSWQKVLQQTWQGWQKRGAVKWLVAAACVIALGMFTQRDVINVVRYHAVAPDCAQVLSRDHCRAYDVWLHDDESHDDVVTGITHVNPNPLGYTFEWMYWLWYRLFFAVNGPDDDFRNYPPLPLPAAAFAAMVVTATIALAVYGRRTLAGRPYLLLLTVVIATYLLTLYGAGYLKYCHTGVLELMNGRYLFPVLLLGAAVVLPALLKLARKLPNVARYTATLVLLLCFLDGGGVLTFISRSDAAWYWPNKTVQHVNRTAQKTLDPLIVDGPRYYFTNRWFFN